jgi:hypothetical protein
LFHSGEIPDVTRRALAFAQGRFDLGLGLTRNQHGFASSMADLMGKQPVDQQNFVSRRKSLIFRRTLPPDFA